jgi:hypothetical protein
MKVRIPGTYVITAQVMTDTVAATALEARVSIQNNAGSDYYIQGKQFLGSDDKETFVYVTRMTYGAEVSLEANTNATGAATINCSAAPGGDLYFQTYIAMARIGR